MREETSVRYSIPFPAICFVSLITDTGELMLEGLHSGEGEEATSQPTGELCVPCVCSEAGEGTTELKPSRNIFQHCEALRFATENEEKGE